MKNTLKTMLAVMSLSLALTACGSKPAETTEVAADTTVVAMDSTAADTAATVAVDSAAAVK